MPDLVEILREQCSMNEWCTRSNHSSHCIAGISQAHALAVGPNSLSGEHNGTHTHACTLSCAAVQEHDITQESNTAKQADCVGELGGEPMSLTVLHILGDASDLRHMIMRKKTGGPEQSTSIKKLSE